MFHRIAPFFVIVLGLGLATASSERLMSDPPAYPESRRGACVDDYHGTRVADPYRWLEDLDSEETAAWVEAQNKVTFGWLKQLPQRESIKKRLTQLWDYERFGLPRKRGNRYFYERNDGLQNQSVLYVADGLDGQPRVLLDPNKLSADGTVNLTDWQVSDDGRFVAFALSSAGSDWKEWKVLDADSGRQRSDHLRWGKFSGASWTKDNNGFFYSRYDEPAKGAQYTGANYFQKLYYHRLGDPQDRDTLIYQRNDQKEWGFDGEATEDGRYLIIKVWRGTERKHQIFYTDLGSADAPVVEMVTGFDAEFDFVGNDGPVLWFLTDFNAPRRRVIAIDLNRPERSAWREVIGEADDVLENVELVGRRFFAFYLQDAHSLVKVYDLTGQYQSDVCLPSLGSASGFRGRIDDQETFYMFASFTSPPTIFRYNVAAGVSRVFRQPRVDSRPEEYETKQVFFLSADGTRVPMFLIGKKDVLASGNRPTILYGYGGFNIAMTPGFSVTRLAWLEAGGLYAVANLRGGGEYGRAWHEAGMKENKQKVFDDFLAAAQWLIDNRYTSARRLAIQGGSNGGLLVGAAMTQRPELFAAAVPAVGVMDMLRYHKYTIGWAWASEFGTADQPHEFRTLYAYSPLHNLQPGTRYPATLITTGDHDDRVVPAHSYKFAAALQAAQAPDGAPVMIRIETSAGHGAGKPTSKIIEESADVLAFLAAILRLEMP